MNSRSTAPLNSIVDLNAFKGMKPNRVVPVPPEFRRPTRIRERDRIINDVKTKTGCTMIPHWDYQRGQDEGTIYQFDFFGTGAGLESAVKHIQQWISRAPNKSKESSAWAKMPAFNADKWYYEQIEEMEKERKQAFKGPAPEPHECELPLYKTTVRWPTDLDDRDISPRSVFNNKLEALDVIRTGDEVYITLLGNKSGEWQIEIQAHEIENVEAAEEHLKTMIEKVKAGEMGMQNTVNMILDDQEGMEVVLERACSWWPKPENCVVPRLLSSGMMELPGSFRREMLHPTKLSEIQHSFQLALEAARSRKGAYDLVIRLGCLAIQSKQIRSDRIGTKVERAAFLKDVETKIRLNITRWLADDATGHQMLRSLCEANELLEPIKSTGCSSCRPDTLDETRPMFRGTWVFRDPSSDVSAPREPPRHSGRPTPLGQKPTTDSVQLHGLIVVQVDWIDNDEGTYEKCPPRFYRLEQGEIGLKMNMDINLLELGESRGWHFALESMIPVSSKSISPVLTRFAEQVRMRPGHDRQSSEKFAQWDATQTIKRCLLIGRLEAVYSFGIKKTYYRVEMARIWYSTQKLPVWGLAIRHTEWANRLAELEKLPVGRKAGWGHTITTFLPDDGQSSYTTTDEDEDLRMSSLNLGVGIEAPPRSGIRILMEKLLQVSAVVSSITDAAGGVAI